MIGHRRARGVNAGISLTGRRRIPSSGSRVGTRHRERAIETRASDAGRHSDLSSQRLTAFFRVTRARCLLDRFQKIDQSMPIVAETEQIANRRNFFLKSIAQISDGSGARCLSVHRKICVGLQCVTMDKNNRVGVKGQLPLENPLYNSITYEVTGMIR